MATDSAHALSVLFITPTHVPKGMGYGMPMSMHKTMPMKASSKKKASKKRRR